MSVTEELSTDRILIGLKATRKTEILREILAQLEQSGVVSDLDEALAEFLERESRGSTGIGNGIAIPHVRSGQVSELEYAFANSDAGIDFESLDGEPVHIVFMLLAPADSHGVHIKALARVSKILNDEATRVRLRRASSPAEVTEIIRDREEALER